MALGMGVAPLPDVAVTEERRSGQLVRLAWQDQPLDVASHQVWNPQRPLSPSLRAFQAFCSEALGPERDRTREGWPAG